MCNTTRQCNRPGTCRWAWCCMICRWEARRALRCGLPTSGFSRERRSRCSAVRAPDCCARCSTPLCRWSNRMNRSRGLPDPGQAGQSCSRILPCASGGCLFHTGQLPLAGGTSAREAARNDAATDRGASQRCAGQAAARPAAAGAVQSADAAVAAVRRRGVVCLSGRASEQANRILRREVAIRIRLPALDDGTPSPVAVPSGCRTLLAAGRLVPEKGFRTLLEAFALLDDPAARLVIVGAGPEEQALRHRCARAWIVGARLAAGFRAGYQAVAGSGPARSCCRRTSRDFPRC